MEFYCRAEILEEDCVVIRWEKVTTDQEKQLKESPKMPFLKGNFLHLPRVLYLLVSKAVGDVIIYHSGGLHVRINYCGAYKFETPLFKVFTKSFTRHSSCGYLF